MGKSQVAVLAILVLAGVEIASGQSASSLVGRGVMTIKWDVEFKRGTDVLYKSPLGKVYAATKVNGEWLWLEGHGRKGWVQRADVVANDQALPHFNRLVQQDPSPRNYHHRSIARLAHDDEDGALADINEAIRRAPRVATYYNHRGNVWNAAGQGDKAIAEYTAAIRLDAKDAIAYVNRGMARAEKVEVNDLMSGIFDDEEPLTPARIQDEYRKAVSDFNEAIRVNPQYTNAYAERAAAYRNLGELDRAIVDYSEAMRRDPTNLEYVLERGATWREAKNFDKAIADHSEAIRLEPTAINHSIRSYTYELQGDHGRAIADLEEALRLEANNMFYLTRIATLYAASPSAEHRNGRRAVELATRAEKQSTGRDEEVIATLAAAHAEAGNFSKAVELQQRAVELSRSGSKAEFQARLDQYRKRQPYRLPVNRPAVSTPAARELLSKGAAAEKAAKPTEALEAYDNAIAGGGLSTVDLARAHFQRGSIHGYLGNFIHGISDFTQCISLNPKFGEAYSLRGYLNGIAERYSEAEKDHLQATALTSSENWKEYPAWAQQHYADLLRRRREFDKALAACEKGLAASDYAIVYFRRAWIYMDMGRTTEAKADFARFEAGMKGQNISYHVFWPDERSAIVRLRSVLGANMPPIAAAVGPPTKENLWPMARGTKWYYKEPQRPLTSPTEATVSMVRTHDGNNIALIDYGFGNKGARRIMFATNHQGIFRVGEDGANFSKPFPMVLFPIDKPNAWTLESSIRDEQRSYVMRTEIEEVTVPTGTYDSVVVTAELTIKGVKSVEKL
jgi:tetratricopeptide (TPR) repeat protein